MSAAVGHLALVVPQLALQALPAGETAALAVLVVAVAGAQQGADAWGGDTYSLLLYKSLKKYIMVGK